MDREPDMKCVMEHMLFDASAQPPDLFLSLLKYITNDFSDDQQTGRGQVSTVYKRLLGNTTIATKELNETLGILENKFNEEVGCLIKTKHRNNLQFLEYCCETRGIIVDHEGKFDKCTTGVSRILDRRNCYEIIEGICEGLDCLHVKRCILHLDLKPANILLDDTMAPKIADFGIPRWSMQRIYGTRIFWMKNNIQVRHIQFGCYNHRDTNRRLVV